MKKVLGALVVLVLLVAAGAAGAAWWYVNSPASSSSDEVIVEIPHGAGARVVSEELAAKGVVKNATAFRYYVKFQHAGNELHAGEFLMRRDFTPAQVLEVIRKDEVVLHKCTIPEGLTAKEIAGKVEECGLASAVEFLKITEDPLFAKSLGLPTGRLEGYLFPDTYEFEKNPGVRLIASTMVKHFQAVWTPELSAKAKALGLSDFQAVTLASIVEKETGQPQERGLVAGVYYNRLKKGMKLEADPTIIYGMVNYQGKIHSVDIHDPSNLYNTYVIKGLPPGPIASPGADALLAVADPAKVDYIFFVACGAQSAFAADLKTHDRNVARCQLGINPDAPKKPRHG